MKSQIANILGFVGQEAKSGMLYYVGTYITRKKTNHIILFKIQLVNLKFLILNVFKIYHIVILLTKIKLSIYFLKDRSINKNRILGGR